MAALNTRAVLAGFVVTLAIGIIGGLTLPLTGITLPSLGWAATGLLGGFVAGYVAGDGVGNGVVNGIVGTTLGALIVGGILAVLGTVLFGLVGLATVLVWALYLGFHAIPGAIGGGLGGMVKRREPEPAGRPTGR
ncbi:DUF5518 domain-containing protein [Halorientalis pallida]|uniref:DUF5518 domain-containing protein n=1 Tax=Halorientalis pallida TaxID=2479928 RepID=A0A498L2B6_9EURY|nr:DUF5518 domain-containing protein [Halorientalis pallida]RXK51431.1 hypothetical protein EAF64_01980 [Halorientalis pallida]